jgi:DNA-binding winged helix-turn-helix (wHTH) protein
VAKSEQPAGYLFGSFVLDLEWGGLFAADGRELPLRPKSFALLCLLVEKAGCLVPREAIMADLWPNLFVTENNVTQCIRDIRCALGSEGYRALQTIPRRGYRFTLDVIAIPRGGMAINEIATAKPARDQSHIN